MYSTYILRSNKNGSYYVGSTSDLNRRLTEHNSGKVRSTKRQVPWAVFYIEKFQSQRGAILRERQIKSWKSRSMIEKLKLKEVARPRPSRGEAGEDPRFCNSDMIGNKIGTTP